MIEAMKADPVKDDAAKQIEAIYQLSPMQEGMLFHTLMNPGTGIYLMQNRYYVEGDVDATVFRQAWEQVIARHSILRTSFAWKSQKRPLQAVHKQVEIPLDVMDWRGTDRAEQISRLDVLLQRELETGFDFAKAPLMRLRLIRLTDHTYQFTHSFHHILLDEWCISPLLMDFLAHYEACAQGLACKAEKPRPYRDYIAWLQKQDVEVAQTFWRDYLRGFSTPTPLAYDRPPEGLADQNEDAADYCVHLDAETTAALISLAQRHRLTPNTFVQGAWAILLSYYSGDPDVLFGVTVAGRPTDLLGMESVLGLFINTLPLRVRVSPERQILPWLKDLLAENIRLRQFEYAPLVKIQRCSEVPRGEALFHSLFVFENAPVDPALCEGRIMFRAEEEQYRVHTNYPMTVMGWPGKELGLKLSYDRRLFESDTVVRMIGHLKRLLEGIISHPASRIADLPLLAPDETIRLLSEWNEQEAKRTDERDFPSRFEAQVRRTPDAIAVTYQEEGLTYGELNRRANRLARALVSAGVGGDMIVAVLDERGPDLLTMILGVFKAGAAYLPLDPHHPALRMARVLELSRPPVVVTSTRLRDQLAAVLELRPESTHPHVLILDDVLPERGSDDNLNLPTRGDQLAYVIYTSGSTGMPKGAMVTRSGMLNNMDSKLSSLRMAATDVVAQTSSQCFDISVWQFLTALLCGGRTHIVPDDIVRDPAPLLSHLEDAGVTLFEAVPAVLQAMLSAADALSAAPSLASLRWVLPTGEALPPAVCRHWFSRYPTIPLLNAYGPAECADDVAVYPMHTAPGDDVNHVPIGRAIRNIRLYIVNRFLALVPPGVSGELCVGGIGVGRGYLQDPVRTAESFVPNPFGSERGERIYRTGDLARYRRDGTIEYLSRLDNQVKIRGFRIELGEIEAHMSGLPAVREAVVVVREDRPGEKRLVAYVAAHDRTAIEAGQLRTALQAQLPDYMVPHLFVILDVLPRTPNGKIDRQALPAPDIEGMSGTSFVAARTVTEELLAGIWTDILSVERVGMDDNFFELGGHSLLATQIVSRIRGAFQIEIPLRTAFECPTVAELARAVDRLRQEGSGLQAPPLVPVRREKPALLSFAQQRLWFLGELEPESWSYNLPFGLRIKGELDLSVLGRSINEVVRRHEVLRTTITVDNDQPIQIIAPEWVVSLMVEDFRCLSDSHREEEVRGAAKSEAHRLFDLSQGPLWRMRVLRLGEQEHVILLTLHHIIADGWSLNVLMQEFLSLYEAFESGRTPMPSPLPIQYADYAHWQRDWLQGDVLNAQLKYWKTSLDGAPAVLSLPTDRPRPAVEGHHGARHEFLIPADIVGQLRALSRRQGATLFMTLLGAFQVLLLRYSGQTDLCIGTPIANRTRLEIEPLIGLFVNTLVLRTDLAGNPTFTGLLARVKEVVLGAQTHQDLPFEKLVDELQPMRALSHAPLFQVMFALQTLSSNELELPGFEISTFDVDPGSAQFDLSLDLLDSQAGVEAVFEYNADLFNAGTIERMAAHLQRILQGIIANPDARLSDVPLLTESESHQVLVEWNDTASAGQEDASFAELFEAQVERTPNAVAVAGETCSFTYRDLDRRANRIADALSASGVGPDSIVAVLNERDPGSVAMLIGILKAGGAYLPLDPAHPAPRWASILELSRAAVVLTADLWTSRLADALALLPQSARPRLLTIEEILNGAEAGDRPLKHSSPFQLAYVIYTSGSTGTPKGAMVTQQGLTNHLMSKLTMLHLGPGDVIAQTASLCFDISVWQCITALLCGGRTLVVPDEIAHDPERLLVHLREQNVTVLEIVPTLLQALLDVPSPGQTAVLSTLRWVLPTGEALSPDLSRRWFEHSPDIPLLNAYGPAECADDVAIAEITVPPEKETVSMPIGRPIHNMRLYILDRWLAPVPIGTSGELCVAGPGVGRGYLNDPSRTAEAFVPNPFAEAPDDRLYKTGDLARYRSDGTIEFLGRLDHQIKLRGVRIELGEVEARLQSHPEVHEAVAVVREDKPGQRKLVAYVTPYDGAVCDGEALCRMLREQLPDTMVPSIVVSLDALPRTPNGKVDRAALPVPGFANHERQWVAPRSAAEETLVNIWMSVLGIERIGIHDNFFELGGDSILALQIVSRAKQAGLMLTPRQMFQHQTPEALAAVVGTDHAIEGGRVLLPPEQGPVTGEFPLTPIQHWFFEREFPDPNHWNQSLLLEVRKPLDYPALDRAVQYLQQQHDVLRARFIRDDGQWRQHIDAETTSPVVHQIDLSTLSESMQRERVHSLATEWQASLNVVEGPLLRVVWFDMGSLRPGRLLLIIHHLVIDGVSWRILLEDLENAYVQHRRGDSVRLPAKSTSFKQWSERLQQYGQSDRLQDEASYWVDPRRAMLAPLPVDEPEGDRTEASSESLSAFLQEEETHALLREVPAAYQTQINDVLLTALSQTVARWTDQRLVLIDLEGHGREDVFPELDISRTVGWFTAVAPVLLEIGQEDTPGDALKTVKEQLRRIPNRGVGYGMLRYLQAGDAAERLRTYPEAHISFNYLGQLDQTLPEDSFLGLADESPGMEHALHNRLPYELYINAEVLNGRLNMTWTYSRNRFQRETVEGLSHTCLRLLQELIAHCVSPEAGGYTPSDFPDVEIGQQALDAILERMGGSHAR
jgi:amino acid adenylation domain-containing protein/non-ribosomal peptide synthase protein (TIGR01720 family)